jgi:hypothetical protein
MNEGSLLCLTGPTDAIPRPMEFISLRFLPGPINVKSAGYQHDESRADPESV